MYFVHSISGHLVSNLHGMSCLCLTATGGGWLTSLGGHRETIGVFHFTIERRSVCLT